jgi:hypothetical protein
LERETLRQVNYGPGYVGENVITHDMCVNVFIHDEYTFFLTGVDETIEAGGCYPCDGKMNIWTLGT